MTEMEEKLGRLVVDLDGRIRTLEAVQGAPAAEPEDELTVACRAMFGPSSIRKPQKPYVEPELQKAADALFPPKV